jgi:beta-lactamase class A
MGGHTAARSKHVRRVEPSTRLQLGVVAIAVVLCAGPMALGRELAEVQAPDRASVDAAVTQGGSEAGGSPPTRDAPRSAAPSMVPTAAALRDASTYARRRGGAVSFAVVDTAGRLRGRAERRGFVSASVIKAMLLVAEVRRLEREDASLDTSTEALLRAMITYSDNDAADAIYSRVGDGALFDVARDAGMSDFTVAGYWGNAQVTAADMARLFSELERLLQGPHREFALGLLGSVIEEQSWGIPPVARPAWAVRFKGGWRSTDAGQLVHQAAELRRGERKLSIAVLTDGQPTHEYGVATVEGIARRLLSRSAPGRSAANRADGP